MIIITTITQPSVPPSVGVSLGITLTDFYPH